MSDDVNLREFVTDALKKLTPKNWRWVAYGTNLDEIDQTTVVLTLKSISRSAEAPQSKRRLEYVLTIADPSDNAEQREDSLDDSIVDLLGAIDATKDFTWTAADRALANARNLAYDITLVLPIAKTTTSQGD